MSSDKFNLFISGNKSEHGVKYVMTEYGKLPKLFGITLDDE